jgi:excisionase family DNA binding protein
MAADPTTADDELFTVDEIATKAKTSPRQVRRWLKNHELIAHRFGRLVRISRGDWKLFLRQRRGLG